MMGPFVQRFFVLGALATVGGCEDSGTSGDGDADADTDGDADALAVTFHPGELTPTGSSTTPALLLAEVRGADSAVIQLAASSDPAATCEVFPDELAGGGVAEVFLRANESHAGQTVRVTLQAEAGGATATDSIDVQVSSAGDDTREVADELIAVFLEYIAGEYPESGLAPDAEWVESYPTYPGIVIVMHRTYLTEVWDLHLAWHAMIAPHDWAYVTLRRRGELEPETGLCFPSQTEDRTVQEADLADPRLPCAAE